LAARSADPRLPFWNFADASAGPANFFFSKKKRKSGGPANKK
jgi:hypothetical protein